MKPTERLLRVLAALSTTALLAGCAGVSHFADTEHQDLTDWLFHRRHTHHLDRPIADDSMFALAGDLTRLEDQIRRDGSITVKTPDVWGESNLMHYIQEYDQILAESVDDFEPSVQGFYSVADSAVLSSATSVQIAEADAPQLSLSAETIDLSDEAVVSVLEKVLDKGPGLATAFELEPTETERQRSTFVRVNQGLRLKNVGGDNVRDAGYALYKFRIPVSILPGRETSAGYSAVVTMQAEPRIDEASLRNAFQRMVVADVVERLRGIDLESPSKPSTLTAASGSSHSREISLASGEEPLTTPIYLAQDDSSLRKSVQRELQEGPQKWGPVRIPDFSDVPGGAQAAPPVAQPEVLPAAGPATSAIPRIATGNDYAAMDKLRRRIEGLYISLESSGRIRDFASAIFELERLFESGLSSTQSFRNQYNSLRCAWESTLLANDALAVSDRRELDFSWEIVQNVALADLNMKRLLEDLHRRGEIDTATYEISRSEAVCFFAPELSLEPTLATWRLLLEKEFPVHVFALDPDVEEQNIVAAFQRQRELQLALAVGVAKRYFGMNQRLAASRRLALEQAEIELNRVAISFSHGNDTFGWYFHPRLQAPPAESSNLAAFTRTLWSTGPTENYDLKNRRLEPGTRECEALIVMPSFLEYVDFRVTTNWEQVNHPGVTKQSYEEMIDLGRQLQCARNRIPSISDQHCFRPGDFDRLIHRFDQLEKMLSLQTHSIGVPYEYGGGTEELFSRGDAQHYPRLIGYYGVSFVKAFTKPEEVGKFGVEFFLEGKNFHPTLTHVIVGGQESHLDESGAEIEVISRNLLRVTVNTLDATVSADGKAQVFVATPAGLSNMIEISFPKPKPEPKGFVLDKSHVWGARWICGQGLAFEPARPVDETIMIKHTDAETPLLPGPYHPGLQPFVAVRVTGVGEDGKPIKFVKPGDASFLQSPPIPANYDARSGIFHVGSSAVAGAVAAELFRHRPEPEGKSFQLNVELYVKFDAWPAEKVSPTISIRVASDCCRPEPPCAASSSSILLPTDAVTASPAAPATTTGISQDAVSELQNSESAESELLPSLPIPANSGRSHHAPHTQHRLHRLQAPLHGAAPALAHSRMVVPSNEPALNSHNSPEFVPGVAP